MKKRPSIRSIFPIITSLQHYDKTSFKGDLAAGLTVAVMLIPQGMAYALIAGLPPVYGLYASTIPLIIYAIFGTSRQLAVGPVAMISLLTATGVGAIANGDLGQYINMAIVLALSVGLIQLLLGTFKMGFLVNFVSHPVISGFTSAAAIIIGLSQLKHLLGIEISRTHYIHDIIIQAIEKSNQINWLSLAIGIGGIFIIVILKKINKQIPGLLITVIIGILIVWGLDLAQSGLKVVGEVPGGLPSLVVPTLDYKSLRALLPIALAISFVSFMESFAVAKTIQSKIKSYNVQPDQELIALGLANIGGSFFQSYPTTGGFSRTAVNYEAGARTNLAAIITALMIVMTLLFLTPLFYHLPNAILSSVIMVAVFGLIDIKEARYLWRVNRSDFWMLLTTFIATLALGIEQGIGVGVLLSIVLLIYKTSKPHIAILGKITGTNFYRNIDRFKNIENRSDILIVRFDAQLFFANANYFKDQIESFVLEMGPDVKAIIISAESINNVDSSALHAIEDLVLNLKSKGLDIHFSGVIGPVRDILHRSGLLEKLDNVHFFMGIQEAIDYHDEQMSKEL